MLDGYLLRTNKCRSIPIAWVQSYKYSWYCNNFQSHVPTSYQVIPTTANITILGWYMLKISHAWKLLIQYNCKQIWKLEYTYTLLNYNVFICKTWHHIAKLMKCDDYVLRNWPASQYPCICYVLRYWPRNTTSTSILV